MVLYVSEIKRSNSSLTGSGSSRETSTTIHALLYIGFTKYTRFLYYIRQCYYIYICVCVYLAHVICNTENSPLLSICVLILALSFLLIIFHMHSSRASLLPSTFPPCCCHTSLFFPLFLLNSSLHSALLLYTVCLILLLYKGNMQLCLI